MYCKLSNLEVFILAKKVTSPPTYSIQPYFNKQYLLVALKSTMQMHPPSAITQKNLLLTISQSKEIIQKSLTIIQNEFNVIRFRKQFLCA